MNLGFSGKILIIDLTSGKISEEEYEEDVYRKYYGGYGLGVYYIYKNIKIGCDPLGPDNIIGFLPGLLTGSPASMTGRYVVCAKSPLTGKGIRSNGKQCNGGWGNANSGGDFGPAIRRTGYDGIFFRGKAAKPVYLLINNDKISLEDAKELWGKDIVITEQILKEKHGQQFKISSIGQAGENRSLISGIVTNGGRIAARSGLGAVMGSKNLKALCLKGNNKTNYYDKKQIVELSRKYNRKIKKYINSRILKRYIQEIDRLAPIVRKTQIDTRGEGAFFARMVVAGFGKIGTPTVYVINSQNGDSPVKNFKGIGYIDYPMKDAMKIRGINYKKYFERPYGCYACPVRCGAILRYDKLPFEEKYTHRPEYETTTAFGTLVLNFELETVIQINELLNRSGMDSLSAGNVVAFVMECVENGLLEKSDFKCKEYPEGFLPIWGDSETIFPLLKLIISREGIGDKLADGTKRASELIAGSEEFTMNANGQELPLHDPRFDPGLGLTYITDPSPGRHTAGTIGHEKKLGVNHFIKEIKFENSNDPYKKGECSSKIVKFHQTIEALGFCSFAMVFARYPYLEMINAAFGWDITPEELLQTGHRIQTLRQMFNAREGAIRHELSSRVLGNPPYTKGPLKNVSLDLEVMAQGYYKGMGFDENGLPKEETLKELNLDYCIPDFKISTGVPKKLVNEYIINGKNKPYHFSVKF